MEADYSPDGQGRSKGVSSQGLDGNCELHLGLHVGLFLWGYSGEREEDNSIDLLSDSES